MVQRLERAHPDEDVGEVAGERQADIDRHDPRRDLRRARQHLAAGVEGFGAEDLHAADPQFGQEHHRHDDDADAAEPLQHGSPEQQAFRQLFEPDEHRRAGRGQAGHRLEHRVDRPRLGRAEDEGHRAEQRQRHPDAGGEEEGLLHRQPVAHAIRAGDRHEDADAAGDDRALAEGLPVGVAVNEVDREGNQHRRPETGGQKSDHVADGAQVLHPEGFARGRNPVKPAISPARSAAGGSRRSQAATAGP